MKMRLIALVLAVVLTSCAKRVPVANSFAANGFKVGTVALSTAELPADRENRADKIQLESQVQERTLEALRVRNLFDPTSRITMAIHINQFRLRHGATRYFTGVFSGSDRLGATLTVSDGSTTLLSKQLEVSGGNGNPFAISSSSRGANLSNDLANLAVTSLQRDAMLNTPAPAKVDLPTESSKRQGGQRSSPTLRSSSCSIEQVLRLKEQNFSEQQIKAACAS
jgi:hypothetical protein